MKKEITEFFRKVYFSSIERKVYSVGEKLAHCSYICEGIINKPELGIIPRCLYFEYDGNHDQRGCIIVGINPTKSNSIERQHYIEQGISYESIKQFWQDSGINNRFYSPLREFVRLIGISGPILWTELVKCENSVAGTLPPLQTFRNCTHNFLSKELKLFPENWLIIGVGREPHKALSYLYPERSVLGVPHPTSSRGNFSKLFIPGSGSGNKSFNPIIKQKLEAFLTQPGIELWLR